LLPAGTPDSPRRPQRPQDGLFSPSANEAPDVVPQQKPIDAVADR
jgi:hypothetical protein